MPSPVHLRKNNDPWIPFPACEKPRRFFPTTDEKTRRNADVRLFSPRNLEYHLFDRFDEILIVRQILDLDKPRGAMERKSARFSADIGSPIIGGSRMGRRFAYNRASFDDVSFRAFPTLLFSADARRPPHVPRTSGYNTRWAGWQPVIFYRPGEKLSTPSTRARVYYLRFIYSIEW